MNNQELAAVILEKVGGKDNVLTAGHCATRLRLKLADIKKADTEYLRQVNGIVGVVDNPAQYQIVIGAEVTNVYKEFVQLGNFHDNKAAQEQAAPEEKKNIVLRLLDVISGIFFPVVPALAGVGMLKAVLAVCLAVGWLSVDMETFQVLNFVSDTAFYFLPFLLAVSSAKQFNCNPFIAMTLAGVLLHPTFIKLMGAAKDAGTNVHLLGIPIPYASYGSSVVPILLTVWLASYIEPFMDKIIPNVLKIFLVPLFTLLLTAPFSLLLLAPLGNIIGMGLGDGFAYLNQQVSWLVPLIVGTFTPLMVMMGMHYGLVPIGINSLATKGFDTVAGPGMMVSNIAQGGAALAVALKAKDTGIRQLATSTGISAVLGITEPALYGINLRFKKPLLAAMIGGGCGGLYIGIMGVGRYVQVAPGLLALTSYISPDGALTNLTNAAIGCAIAFVVSFGVSWGLGFVQNEERKEAEKSPEPESCSNLVYAPIKGQSVPLSEVDDDAFAMGILGNGVAIIPEEGKVFAPVDGEITALYDSKHAVGLRGDDGMEILIHVGLDTVRMEGRHYTEHVVKGQKVKKGDLLLEFDIQGIKDEGFDVISPVVVLNTGTYADVLGFTGKEVEAGQPLIEVIA